MMSLNYPESFVQEFATIECLTASNFVTGHTDAFIVAYVKVEKQVRRIFSFLVYQFPSFTSRDYLGITNEISSRRFLGFNNFIKGFDALYTSAFKQIVGEPLFNNFVSNDLIRIRGYRNKILHGQPTGKGLSKKQLGNEVFVMKNWCSNVAISMDNEIGFDGFKRNSFRKSNKNFQSLLKPKSLDVKNLGGFIDKYLK